jgi:exosome complex RNA-binding protein Csl4
MITFKQDTELEIVESFDEAHDTIAEKSNETFKAGELVDAEIVSRDGEYVDLQFGGGGGLALGVQRSCFVVKREKN